MIAPARTSSVRRPSESLQMHIDHFVHAQSKYRDLLLIVVDFPLSLCPNNNTLTVRFSFSHFRCSFRSLLMSSSICSLIRRASASAWRRSARDAADSLGGGASKSARGSGVSEETDIATKAWGFVEKRTSATRWCYVGVRVRTEATW